MPVAGDDAHGDLALALAQRIAAGLEMRAERAGDLRERRIVDPDLGRAGQTAARLDQRVVAGLLLRGHLIVGDFGIAAERRRLGHGSPPSFVIVGDFGVLAERRQLRHRSPPVSISGLHIPGDRDDTGFV